MDFALQENTRYEHFVFFFFDNIVSLEWDVEFTICSVRKRQTTLHQL